jgi:hypothetical protein
MRPLGAGGQAIDQLFGVAALVVAPDLVELPVRCAGALDSCGRAATPE